MGDSGLRAALLETIAGLMATDQVWAATAHRIGHWCALYVSIVGVRLPINQFLCCCISCEPVYRNFVALDFLGIHYNNL